MLFWGLGGLEIRFRVDGVEVGGRTVFLHLLSAQICCFQCLRKCQWCFLHSKRTRSVDEKSFFVGEVEKRLLTFHQ